MEIQHRVPGTFPDSENESEDTLPLLLSSESRSAAAQSIPVPVTGHQRHMLSEFATQLDSEEIAETRHIVQDSPLPESPIDECADCGKRHIPRRVVCCVDGTWMAEDGAKGSCEGNASNVFRIFAVIREGEIEGKDGKRWQQIRKYFNGIGADQTWYKRIVPGITGNGFAPLIAKIYRYCVLNCCPSQDEIFFFGFSRGAFIVRAVIGLYHHMGTLRPNIEDWEGVFTKGLDIYRSMRSFPGADKHKHGAFHHFAVNTQPSPIIKFVGLFDTVKAVEDNGLYDISQTANTLHVRHALAILEARRLFKPERYENETGVRLPADGYDRRTCLEAWFLGSHGDLGGSCKQDGLSLWPLQWILSEACKYGLFLGFKAHDLMRIEDPLMYTMPAGKGPHRIPFKNGANIEIWNLEEQFLVDGFHPMVNLASYWVTWSKQREIFGDTSKTPATIVHPSVHFEDDMTPLGIAYLNELKYRQHIRTNRMEMDIRSDSLFWNDGFHRRVDHERSKTRVLLCGTLGIGKSSIINLILEETVAQESSGLSSMKHDIDLELTKQGPSTVRNNFVFHDASGFERGADLPARKVQDFLCERQKRPIFEDQLHCIWYCVQTTGRLTQSDVDFFKAINFSYLTVIVVFTKCDELRNQYLQEACKRYWQAHPEQPEFDIYEMPPEASPTIKADAIQHFESAKEEKRKSIKEKLEGDFDCVFVSNTPADKKAVEDLRARSRSSIRAEKLLRIHNQAVERYLQARLPQVLELVVPLAKKAVERVYKVEKVNQTSPILDDLRRKMQEKLPHLYGFRIRQQLIFKDFSALFSELYQNKQIPEWWQDDILTNHAILVSGTVFAALGLAVGAVTGGALTLAAASGGGISSVATITRASSKDTVAITLLQVALIILLHERLCWLGLEEINSKELIARVAVDVLKISPEVKSLISKQLKISGMVKWEAILTDVIAGVRPKTVYV